MVEKIQETGALWKFSIKETIYKSSKYVSSGESLSLSYTEATEAQILDRDKISNLSLVIARKVVPQNM